MTRKNNWRQACLALLIAGSLALIFPVAEQACGNQCSMGPGSGMDHGSMVGNMGSSGPMGPGEMGPGAVTPGPAGGFVGVAGAAPPPADPGGNASPGAANPVEHGGHSGH